MIFLLHNDGKEFIKATKDGKVLLLKNKSLVNVFWELANIQPEELIVWRDQNVDLQMADDLEKNFTHELIMSSYAVENQFIPDQIEYIDQFPFVKPIHEIVYPTWRMSSDIGGIYGKTLLQFEKVFKQINNFRYLLNSIAKTGQQNGLFCYSNPTLIDSPPKNSPVATADFKELFLFVYQHYKMIWVIVLFYCFVRYEKKIPILELLRSFSKSKFRQQQVDLSKIGYNIKNINEFFPNSVDVIIPTMGRAAYVRQMVEDLSEQNLLPQRLIIVEQQPELDSGSELEDLLKKDWPFKIEHVFTRQTGACMARNKALEKVQSEWVFLADDDIRLQKGVLENTLKEAERLGVNCINLNCRQPGEEIVFSKVKQWGSFGSGTSLVRSRFLKNERFSEAFEHGYGEDADFGMKLRAQGCDIIYHPLLEIQHLKAPVGGFRKKPVLAWEKEHPVPKPSPTVMLFAKRYYSARQMKGYKISLYLKYFRKQPNKNLFSYWRDMEKRWKRSEDWAEQLEEKNP